MTDHVGIHKRLIKGDAVTLVSQDIERFKITFDSERKANVKFTAVENRTNYYKLEL